MKTLKPRTSNATSALACPPGALAGGPSRTRFFDGMILTQADLENEQRYWRIKRRLTNRALGTGVVWGLRLVHDAARRRFTLSPGYALDCCGNDLIVDHAVEIGEAELLRDADPGVAAMATELTRVASSPGGDEACLVLQYVECPEEARPAHHDACGNTSGSCQPSRIRESVRLVVVPPPSARTTPPEQLAEELEELRAGLSSEARLRIFGPPPAPAPASAPVTSGALPFTLVMTIPDAPDVTRELQPEAGAIVSVTSVGPVTQVPRSPQGTAVITFELVPSTGFGFVSGEVTDQGRVVETVVPPMSMSMYWSIDLQAPESGVTTARYVFLVDELGYAESFSTGRAGRTDLRIDVDLEVDAEGDQVAVTVKRLAVRARAATLTIDTRDQPRCLEDLARAWAVHPERSGEVAKVLVLSAAYGYLAERSATSASSRRTASMLYAALWYALFRVNLLAATPDERAQLSTLIQRLFETWCRGFLYPGPRCEDEHHGIYVGCVRVDRGRVIEGSLDVWSHRRQVVTGALLGYWAEQLGVAPVDIVVGRFARAMCCIAGLPAPDVELTQGNQAQQAAVPKGAKRAKQPDAAPPPSDVMDQVMMGSPAQVRESAAKRHGATAARRVSWTDLVSRTLGLFTAAGSGGARELLTFEVPGGAAIGVVVPSDRAGAAETGKLTVAVRDALTAVPRLSSQARATVAAYVVELAHGISVGAIDARKESAALQAVVARLDEHGVTMAEVVDDAPDALLARIGGSSADREPLDQLVDAVEIVIVEIAIATAAAVKPGLRRDKLADPEFLTAAERVVAAQLDGRVDTAVVAQAADRARQAT